MSEGECNFVFGDTSIRVLRHNLDCVSFRIDQGESPPCSLYMPMTGLRLNTFREWVNGYGGFDYDDVRSITSGRIQKPNQPPCVMLWITSFQKTAFVELTVGQWEQVRDCANSILGEVGGG